MIYDVVTKNKIDNHSHVIVLSKVMIIRSKIVSFSYNIRRNGVHAFKCMLTLVTIFEGTACMCQQPHDSLVLVLVCDASSNTMRCRSFHAHALQQGDTYEELGVTVDDRNDDESERKIRMEYSKPPGELGRGSQETG